MVLQLNALLEPLKALSKSFIKGSWLNPLLKSFFDNLRNKRKTLLTSSSIEPGHTILHSPLYPLDYAGMLSREVEKPNIDCVGYFIVKNYYRFLAGKQRNF